jgi:MYXO-CTERM domain-containing protein
MRFAVMTFAALFFAAPAQATFGGICDVQLRINAVLEFEDPQEGSDPSCDSGDFDTGFGTARGFANYNFGLGLPPQHFTGAEIRLTSDTSVPIAAQTFTEWNQGWNITDVDLGRFGAIDLRARITLDWNLEWGASTTGFANAFVNYNEFDTSSNILQTFGFFSCSAFDGAAPTCSGSPSFDLSMININFNGTSYDITGMAILDFNAGSVNSINNYFGLSFGTQVSMGSGINGDLVVYGKGNLVDWEMISTESSVTVTPIPEPAAGGLLAFGLVALAAGRRRSHGAS